MKRMTIQGWRAPDPHAEPASDGLPAMQPLPAPDGKMQSTFIGKRTFINAWHSESVVAIAKTYARTCCAALDIEIDVLKTERDGLKAQLDELRAERAR